MPNSVGNTLTMSGGDPAPVLALLVRADGVVCFQDIVPVAMDSPEWSAPTGSKNWLTVQWQLNEAWGTRRLGWDAEVALRGPQSAQVTFYTAWTPPLPIILALSRQFPDHTFNLKYAEPMAGFSGEFDAKGGQVLRDEMAEDP